MRARLIVPLLLSFALVASACGARLDDQERLDAIDAQLGGSGGTGSGSGGDAGEQASGDDGSSGSGSSGSGSSGSGSSGSGSSGSGSSGSGATGSDGGTGGAGTDGGGGEASCSPQPVEETGVSDTQITIANVATISGPITGFGSTAQNAVKAYVDYINSQGGVCGRTIRLVTGDDRLDTGVNRSETQRLAEEAFGFVGGISVVDDGGAQILEGTNIPDVTLAIGSVRSGLANNFSPNPINPNQPGNGADAPMRYFAEQGVTSAAIVYPNQADARARGIGYGDDLRTAGITTIDEYEVSITETNYVNVAQQIKNKGTQLLVTTLEVAGMARLAQALRQVGYQPQVPFYGAQAYGSKVLELAGDAANGTTLAVTFSIFEDADQVPAMATFLEWYRRSSPGLEPDFFSIMSWAAADMLVDAIRAAGGAPTRDAVLANLQQLTRYDGDGFVAPRNPAGKDVGDCFVVVTVEDGQWRRVEPASGFLNC